MNRRTASVLFRLSFRLPLFVDPQLTPKQDGNFDQIVTLLMNLSRFQISTASGYAAMCEGTALVGPSSLCSSAAPEPSCDATAPSCDALTSNVVALSAPPFHKVSYSFLSRRCAAVTGLSSEADPVPLPEAPAPSCDSLFMRSVTSLAAVSRAARMPLHVGLCVLQWATVVFL